MSRRGTDGPSKIRNQFGQFAQIPEDLVTDPAISDRAIRVYALLWVYSCKKGRDAFPGRRTLADDLQVSLSTIDRGIGELVRRGAISVDERYDGDRQTSNVYTIIAPLPARISDPEVIHRGRKFEAPLSSNLKPSGAANLKPQEQEPEEQDNSSPVRNVTTDANALAAGTGPKPTPATVSATYGHPLHHADVFASLGTWLPATFDDAQLDVLADEIVAAARPSRVFDPTAYVIQTIRNTVRTDERRRGRWLLRADEIALEHAELAQRGAGF
jgi:hypothetical protein